jgi:hypothetical protein
MSGVWRRRDGFLTEDTSGPSAREPAGKSRGVGVVDDVRSEPVVLRLLRRLVLLAGLLAAFFLAGLLLAGPAQASSGRGDSSGGGSASDTTSAVVHAVTSKATPAKAIPAKATPAKATSGNATSGKATPGKATSGKAGSSAATGAVRREAGASTASVHTGSPVAGPRARPVDRKAVVPRLSAARGATPSRARSAVASPAPATTTNSIVHDAPALSIDLGTATVGTSAIHSVLAPATTVTSAVAHVAPAASSLLAPVAALPRTLTGPSGAISQTGSILIHTVTGLTLTGPSGATSQTGSVLIHTVTGLTHTTTALTQTVGELGGSAIGVSGGALTALTALTGTLGAGGPTAPRALALVPGTDADRLPAVMTGTGADRFPAVASTPAPPVLLGGAARDPVPDGGAPGRLADSGSSSAAWLTVEAAGPVSQRVVPDVPSPWDPVAPATPAGTAGVAAGSGVSVLTGALTDPLALAGILTALVLIACGRRWAWWFPEVAVGPD